MSKKMLFAGAVLVALAPVGAFAQSGGGVAAGAATGAVGGAIVGGPIGAAVGGVTGAYSFFNFGFGSTWPLALLLMLLAAVPIMDDIRHFMHRA